MKRNILLVLLIVVGLGGGIAIALNTSNPKPASNTGHDATNSDGHHKTAEAPSDAIDLTDQAEVAIDIKDFAYTKQHIKIKKGTKVTWTNQDTTQHNVMKEHDGAGAAHDAPKPNEVDPDELGGPLLDKGESYSFTFNEIGSDPYHCSPHPNMKGSVTVVD
jgi:plastocyanin